MIESFTVSVKITAQKLSFRFADAGFSTERIGEMSVVNAEEIAGRPIAVIGCGTLGRRIALMASTRGGEVRHI